jgi:membrane protein implicated in regulation of membrane protease activity
MSKPHLPTTAARFGLIALVVAVALIGHWVIPSGLGLVTKFVAIALLVLATLWLVKRWTKRRDARR